MSTIDLSLAARSLAIANTPLFLIKRLKALELIAHLAAVPSDELLLQIKNTLSSSSTQLEDQVRPYVLLAALARKQDVHALAAAAQFRAPHHRWYYQISAVLRDEARPTTFLGIDGAPKIEPTSPTRNNSSSSVLAI